jgi:hypothetical protein
VILHHFDGPAQNNWRVMISLNTQPAPQMRIICACRRMEYFCEDSLNLNSIFAEVKDEQVAWGLLFQYETCPAGKNPAQRLIS